MSDLNKLKELANRTHVEEWEYKVINGDKRVIVKGSLERGQGYFSCRSVVDEIDSTPNAKFIAAANPPTVIGLIDKLEAAQHRIAELEAEAEREGDITIDALDSMREWMLRAKTAEAELARRDAIFIPVYPDENLMNKLTDVFHDTAKIHCDEDGVHVDNAELVITAVINHYLQSPDRNQLCFEKCEGDAAAGEPVANPVLTYADSYRGMAGKGVTKMPIWEVITDLERNLAPLFTAAQPSALPPEIDSLSEPAGDKHSFAMGYNQAIADAKALGSKAIKLPAPYVDNPFDGLFYKCSEVAEMLREQGFTVEGE